MHTVTLSIHISQQSPILHLCPTTGHLNLATHRLNMNCTCFEPLGDVLGYQRHGRGRLNTGLEGDLCPPGTTLKFSLEHFRILNLNTYFLAIKSEPIISAAFSSVSKCFSSGLYVIYKQGQKCKAYNNIEIRSY